MVRNYHIERPDRNVLPRCPENGQDCGQGQLSRKQTETGRVLHVSVRRLRARAGADFRPLPPPWRLRSGSSDLPPRVGVAPVSPGGRMIAASVGRPNGRRLRQLRLAYYSNLCSRCISLMNRLLHPGVALSLLITTFVTTEPICAYVWSPLGWETARNLIFLANFCNEPPSVGQRFNSAHRLHFFQ
jgi:hypothetical protein